MLEQAAEEKGTARRESNTLSNYFDELYNLKHEHYVTVTVWNSEMEKGTLLIRETQNMLIET